MKAEPLAITLLVIEALEKLDIPYLIGGSLASALHGTARSTLDEAAKVQRTVGQEEAMQATSVESGKRRTLRPGGAQAECLCSVRQPDRATVYWSPATSTRSRLSAVPAV